MRYRSSSTAKLYLLREEDYPRWRELDPALPADYTTWRAESDRKAADYERTGHIVRRVEIDPEAFRAWCEQHGRTPDFWARSEYTERVM